jgi:hypothetical protein
MAVHLFKIAVCCSNRILYCFPGVTPYSPVGRNWYFVGTYSFLLLLWKWRQNISPKRCYPPNITWRHNPEEREKHLDLWAKHHHGASCTSVRCAFVDSELGHRLSWLRILFCCSVAPGIYLDITSIVPWPLPPTSFPVHRSLIMIPLHTVRDTDQLTPWAAFSLDKLIVSHMVKQECSHSVET